MSEYFQRKMPTLRPQLRRIEAGAAKAEASRAKISNPTFLETGARTEPEPYQMPKMAEPVVAKPQVVWRVGEADLGDFNSFLDVVLGRFPDADPMALRSWAKASIYDRACLFVRSKQSFAFFLHTISIWEPRGIVREVFLLPESADYRERNEFYRFAGRWAKDIRAKRLEIYPPIDLAEEVVGFEDAAWKPLVLET